MIVALVSNWVHVCVQQHLMPYTRTQVRLAKPLHNWEAMLGIFPLRRRKLTLSICTIVAAYTHIFLKREFACTCTCACVYVHVYLHIQIHVCVEAPP